MLIKIINSIDSKINNFDLNIFLIFSKIILKTGVEHKIANKIKVLASLFNIACKYSYPVELNSNMLFIYFIAICKLSALKNTHPIKIIKRVYII